MVRVSDSAIRFLETDAQSFATAPESFDLAICMGATHAFGPRVDGYRNAMMRLIPLDVPGGLLLVADGYMKQPAAPKYRKLLGGTMPDEITSSMLRP